MSIEREIELSDQVGTIVKWQAYGLNEIELDIPPTVYPPREDTGLLDRTLAKMDSTKGNRLLEIGCGSGAVSIAAALRGWNVSACDVNPLAIAATRGNAAKLGIEWETEIREGGPGDIGNWEPQQGVDVIAWNLPYIEPDSGGNLGPMEDSALIGQDEAEQLLNAISANPRLLNPGGVVLMLHSSNQIGHELTRSWRKAGWATRNVSHTTLGDERLTVVACWRPFENAKIIRLQSCQSTNDEIMNLDNAIQGTLVSTKKQVSGRGYAGREWRNSPGGFMGSWRLSEKSIERGPETLQLAATMAILDTLSIFMNLGLPSHSWIHGSALESCGVRVKWPNDVWLRTAAKLGKLCGVLVEGKTQGDDVQIVLGIGMNRTSAPELEESIGWKELFSESLEEVLPVIHASVASLLEVHAMIGHCDTDEILSSIYASMRMTLSEGLPCAFGLDGEGGLWTEGGVVRTTRELQWKWT